MTSALRRCVLTAFMIAFLVACGSDDDNPLTAGETEPTSRYDLVISRAGEQRGLYLLSSSSSAEVRLTSRDDYGAEWAPDGWRLAFIRGIGADAAVHVARLEGLGSGYELADVRRIADGSQASWSADGQDLLVRSAGGYYKVSADGSGEPTLVAGIAGGSAIFADDGGAIVFRSIGTPGLRRFRIADKTIEAITFRDDSDVSATPDGGLIFSRGERDGSAARSIVERNRRGEVLPLTTGGFRDESPTTSPDGWLIAFTREPISDDPLDSIDSGEIVLLNRATGATRQITHNEVRDSDADWRPAMTR